MISRILGNVGVVLLNRSLAGDLNNQNTEMLVQSESLLKKAVELNGEGNFAWRSLGTALIAIRHEDEAISAWKEAGQSPALLFVVLGNRERSKGRKSEALNSYEIAVNIDPTLTEVWYSIGIMRQEIGMADEAILAFQEAWLQGDSKSGNDLARLFYSKRDFRSAADIWHEALERNPENSQRPDWWQWLALSLRADEQWDRGLRVTSDALAEYPEEPHLYVERGICTI